MQRLHYNGPTDDEPMALVTEHDVLIYRCAACAGGRWPRCEACQSTRYIGVRTDTGETIDWRRVEFEDEDRVPFEVPE